MIVKNTDGPFTVVANEAAQDKELTWKAKGLLLYLLSLPEDWTIRLSHLAEQAQDGITATRSAMNELQERGYVVAHGRERKEDGTYGENVYTVSSRKQIKPEKAQPTLEKPTLEKPTLDFPMWDKLTLQKKEKTKEIKTKETEEYPLTPRGGNQTAEPLVDDSNPEEPKKRKPRVGNLDLPSWLSRESWEDFVEHRKALRKPMTPRAGELMIGRLKKIAAEHGEQAAQDALLNSIAGGWIGIFPPKPQNAPTAPTSTGGYLNANEKNQSLINSWLEEENGNETNDRQSAADLGSQHGPSDSNRLARSLAADFPGSSRRAVRGSTEEAPARDAGEAVSDSWTDLGLATEPATEHGVFFSN